MRIAVVIVNWNAGAWLPRCLQSLAAQERQADSVVLVDNASTDGSLERALRQSSFVDPIRLRTNVGFAAAINVALEASWEADYVALLNPDAFPASSWLAALERAVEEHPRHAAFASQLRSATGGALDGCGDVYHVSGLSWRAGHGSPFPDSERPRDVFSPCAAAALYKRQALVEIGGFDERYFCYFEDVDAGFRLRLRGHPCLYVPDAIVDHVGSATSGGKGSDFSTYHGHRNLVWTFFKNMPPALLAAYLPQHLVVNLASVVWFSARGQARTILRSKRDALRGLPAMLRSRREVQRDRRVGVRQLRGAMARGWLTPYIGRSNPTRVATAQAVV